VVLHARGSVCGGFGVVPNLKEVVELDEP